MTTSSMPPRFARLLHQLSLCEGEDLERTLAASAPMFARLGACAAPRPAAMLHARKGVFSLANAERELARLIISEVGRL